MLLVVFENLLVPLSNYKLVMFMEPIICPIPDFFTQNYQNNATCRYINPSHPITYETNLTTLRIKLIDLVKSRGNTTSKKQALAKLLYNLTSNNELETTSLPKFQVYKDAAGKFRFRLRADNNEIVAVGEAYEKRLGCLNGIKSIQKNSGAPVEDTTIKGRPKLPNPKYEINKDAAGQYRFHLRAGNGQVIADSEGYEKKADCLNGINIVKASPSAEIEDTTIPSQVATEPSTPKIPVVATATTNTIPATVMVAEPIPEEGPDRKDEMLQELKKIRASVEKAPPPTPPKGLWNEFKDFLSKYKILGLAIAFVLGLYLGTLVQSLVTGFVMPLIGLAVPGLGNLAEAFFVVNGQNFLYGAFISALITFLIVAFIAFLVVKVAKKWKID